jgi:hypothetical protein
MRDEGLRHYEGITMAGIDLNSFAREISIKFNLPS